MENIATLLQTALDEIVSSIDAALIEEGLTGIRPSHGVVFDNLDREGTRLSTLAERAGMSKQLMQYLVDPLVAEGYLRRLPDPSDGRGKLLVLTERGWLAVHRAEEVIAGVEARWREEHGERRVRTLRAVLEAVNDGDRR